MERKLSEMEEELKVSSQISFVLLSSSIMYAKANGRDAFELNNEETGHDCL